MHVLILDQGRQSLPFLKAIKSAGHFVTIVCLSKLSEGYFSKYPDKRLIWPNYHDDPIGFKNGLFEFLRKNKPDVTLSLGDTSSEIIACNRTQILKYTNVTVPPQEVFFMARDKRKTMAFCMKNNIPCPKTFQIDPSDLQIVSSKLNFPVMAKPAKGIGAVGLKRLNTHKELWDYFSKNSKKFKNNDLLIQEFIPQKNGMQYQAEAFLDADSKMKACMVIEKPRFFPVTGGTSTANVTVYRPDIVEITRKLLEGIKWIGAADVDFILDPRNNIPKVIEINPRVTAGIKIGFLAGINYADLHLRLAKGLEIPEIKSYQTGIYSRNLIMELLWYFSASKEMKKNTKPSFFKFFGSKITYQTFSIDDPLTGLGFFLGMIRKYSKLKKWREKLGIS